MMVLSCTRTVNIVLLDKTKDPIYCKDLGIADCEVKVTVQKALRLGNVTPCADLDMVHQSSCKELYESIMKNLEIQ